MRFGSRERPEDDVFLLSTTHGAETPSLVAAIATMNVYKTEPVCEHLHEKGAALAEGARQVIAKHGMQKHIDIVGRPCSLFFGTKDNDGKPSQPFRTLFLQEMIARGVLGPSFVISYSHTDEDVKKTIDALDGALGVYARGLNDGVDKYLIGAPSRPVFGRRRPQ